MSMKEDFLKIQEEELEAIKDMTDEQIAARLDGYLEKIRSIKFVNRARFQVRAGNEGLDTYYTIIDTHFRQYNMPEQAVSLHFKRFNDAMTVANTMNAEWTRFQRNPS
jgi:hypothetical protein